MTFSVFTISQRRCSSVEATSPLRKAGCGRICTCIGGAILFSRLLCGHATAPIRTALQSKRSRSPCLFAPHCLLDNNTFLDNIPCRTCEGLAAILSFCIFSPSELAPARCDSASLILFGCGLALHCATPCYAMAYAVLHCIAIFFSKFFGDCNLRGAIDFAEAADAGLKAWSGMECRVAHHSPPRSFFYKCIL